MKALKWALAVAMLLAFAANPVLADGPRPGTLSKSAYTGVLPGGGGKTAARNSLLDKPNLAAPAALTFYAWTNLMRFGSVGVNSGSWGCVNPNEVCSQGWSSTNQNINFLQSGNYLCQNGSCTSYTYFNAYNWHWVWSGWRWSSTMWTWWSTTTYHYFQYGSSTYSKYTSNGQVF